MHSQGRREVVWPGAKYLFGGPDDVIAGPGFIERGDAH